MALFYGCRNCILQIQLLRWGWWALGCRYPSQPYDLGGWMEVEGEVLSMGPGEHGWPHWMQKYRRLWHNGHWCIQRRSKVGKRVTTGRSKRVCPDNSNDLSNEVTYILTITWGFWRSGMLVTVRLCPSRVRTRVMLMSACSTRALPSNRWCSMSLPLKVWWTHEGD